MCSGERAAISGERAVESEQWRASSGERAVDNIACVVRHDGNEREQLIFFFFFSVR